MRTAVGGLQPLERKRVLVEERPAPVIGRRIDRLSKTKAEKDALLDPGVDAPSAGDRRIGLGGAHGPAPERSSERGEHLASGVAIGVLSGGDEIGDLRLERDHRVTAGACVLSDCSTATIRAFDAGSGGTIGSL